MDEIAKFFSEVSENIGRMAADREIKALATKWIMKTSRHKYSYNFTWMGRPVIQYPEDIMALQEIIWKTKPDLIIETGVAHGGSLIFYASMLELLGNDGLALGIDIDIRPHNKRAIEEHPMAGRIMMIQGSSSDRQVADRVCEIANSRNRVMLVLDSNHTHEHVLAELNLYAPLVKKDGYIVVLDTVIADMPHDFFPDRPWGHGNNPKTAVSEFLKENNRFVIDEEMENKLMITVAPSGYLKCMKDQA